MENCRSDYGKLVIRKEEEITHLENILEEKKEELMVLRTQVPGICPWCGEPDCSINTECIGMPSL